MKHNRNQMDCCGTKSSWSWIKIVLIVGVTALLVTAVLQARAQSSAADPDQSEDTAPVVPVHARVVRLSFVQGQLQVAGDGQTQFDQAVANMPLVQGTTLQAGQDGRAEVQFEDGSIFRLTPNSRAQLVALSGAASGSLQTEVSLLSGEGYFDLRPASGDRFIVDALGLRVTSAESSSFRISWLAQPEQVAVSDGTIRIQHADDYNVQVHANETLSIDDADVTRYLLSTGTDADANDAWSADRDQYLANGDARYSGPAPGGDMAGAADLDAYGNYYDVPGVGQVWQPYGYDPSWDPYADGYWAWYPWGYSWISAYPWGWAPYHCGYWQDFAGFGWGWVGNGCGIGIWYPVDPWGPGDPGHRHRPRRPIWHPIPPRSRLHPIGTPKDHPFAPVEGHPVPRTFVPPPVTISGHPVLPRATVPPGERGGHGEPGVHRGPAPVTRSGFGPDSPRSAPVGGTVYGSRSGNPELGRGGNPGSGYHPSPPPAYHPSSPPSASHSSPPPAASHSDSSSSKK